MPYGSLYNETNYFKSINSLGRIGAWQQVDAKPIIRNNDTLDIHFFLVPNIKQNYSIELEASLNTADIGIGNLWGLSTNLGYNNKNVWKRAIQSVASLRTGIELNLFNSSSPELLQTFLVSLGHTYVFPKLIVPFKGWKALDKIEDKKTLFGVSGTYVDRRGYYLQKSLVTNWGYEWKKGKNLWIYKPFNLELYKIDTLDGLRELFITNPFLRSSFNSGNVISQTLSLVKNFNNAHNPDKSHYLHIGIEESGALVGLINGVQNNIYRFIKTEAEYRQVVKIKRSVLAYRALLGLGYNYGKDSVQDLTLPVFKQFSAGGPYSMRAWPLRQLGLGSSTLTDSDTSSNSYRDRFGDMRFEANVEYRFPLATIAGVKLATALFADMGNIWSLKPIPLDPSAQFSFSNFTRDLAIGIGTGIRVDFSYFLIRLDWAYRVKDPARQYNNGWMTEFQWFENRPNGLKVNNYALQLGIGLPF
jgi:outer membrane protein assembly factor BamA